MDFVLHTQKKVDALIQVAWTLEDLTIRKKEIRALVKVGVKLQCKDLFIITWDEERTEEVDKQAIQIIPIWKWLLQI